MKRFEVVLQKECSLKLSHVALITAILVQQFCIITPCKILKSIIVFVMFSTPKCI